ncbi:hypothetical protein C8R43DRAFT_1130285 [Mycena crocata]|nr:hypothetical protein C8R43DRAFT_1130285 [Mycena crocata]
MSLPTVPPHLQALRDRITARRSSTPVPGPDMPLDPNLLGTSLGRRGREEDETGSDGNPLGSEETSHHEFTDGIFTLESGRAYKKQKKLSPESNATCEEFLKSHNPVEHQFILLTTMLQCLDAVNGMSQDGHGKKWVIPSIVKKTATDYARVAVLSPSARSYRGKSLAAAVMAAMHERNVAELPPASETGRHGIKAALSESLDPKSDIATVTRKCTAKSKAQITAGLYYRIAWLTTGDNESPDKDKFWVNVDKALAEFHDSFPDRVDLAAAWKDIYDRDIEVYGPVDSKIRVTPVKDLEVWLATVDTQTSLVEN